MTRSPLLDLKPVLSKKFQPSGQNHRSKSSIKPPQHFEYGTSSTPQKNRSSLLSKHSDKNVYGLDESSLKSGHSSPSHQPGNYDSILNNQNDDNASKILTNFDPVKYKTNSHQGLTEKSGCETSNINVKVCIRVRPLNQRERNGGGKNVCVAVENGTVILDRGFDQKRFHFDFVGEPEISQQQIFNEIAKPIADSCMQGYNGTIFAYGQTGAGKTFTIQGPMVTVEGGAEQMALQNSINDSKGNRGIMQRSFEYIFQNIEAQKKLVEEKADGSELSFLIKCSYLEIYNEQIMDLLEPLSVNLQVREDIKKGVYVEGLQEEPVNTYRDMIHIIQKGAKNRHVGATSMNRESSRSHSVLTTIIESKFLSHTGVWNLKTSRFHIIDLAGSERSKNTNTVGERLKEAGMINKSLSALGNVINSLVDLSEGKSRHVPYRDSKLTFILRDSLGGNSKTVIIANISPSSINVGETLSTLEFAKRAKEIKNKAIVNEDSSGTILVLKNEIKRLKRDLVEQNKMHLAAMSQQQMCRICKSNKVMDSMDDEQNPNEDSMLLDLDNSQLQLSARTKQQQNERIQHVEKLLCSNLENMTNQQKFYENEIASLKEQLSLANQALEAINSQASRDKMKMKLREDKIQKLESEQGLDKDENIKMLNEEIQILKKQLEIEQKNPSKLMKLQSDYTQLKDRNKQLEKDIELDPISIRKQFNDQISLVEQLNIYIKEKVGIEAIENSARLQDQFDELQHQYDVLLQQNVQAEEDNQRLTREYGKAKVEIKQQSEQVQAQMQLLAEQSEQLTALDKSQMKSQQETKENIQKFERMQGELEELIDNITSLECKIKDQNQQIDNKDTEICDLQDLLAASKQEIADLSNDFQTQEEKYQELEAQQIELESELNVSKDEVKNKNDQIQLLLAQIDNLKSNLQNEIVQLQNELASKNDEVDTQKLQLKTQSEESQEKLKTLEETIEDYKIKLHEASTKANQQQSEVQNMQKINEDLENQLQQVKREFETKIDFINANLDQEVKQAQSKEDLLVKQISEQEMKLQELEKTMERNQIDFDQKTKDLQNSNSSLKIKLKEQQSQFEQKIECLENEINQKNEEILGVCSELDDLKNLNRVKEEEKSYLDESIISITNSMQVTQANLSQKEQETDNLRDQLSKQASQIGILKEQLSAAKDLIQQKNDVTAGQEQEVAEQQVLLLEAQNLITQKVQECDSLKTSLQAAESTVLKLEAHLKKKQDEIRQLENEKDNLQFKRDENTKSLEHKLKEVKSRVKDLEAENDCLQGELEKLKNGEMLQQHQKIEGLFSQLQEKSEKQASLLKEVGDMQIYIDDLQDQLDAHKRQATELEKVKKECYQKVQIVQEKSKVCLNESLSLEDQKSKIKEGLSQVLQEVSDFDQYSSDQTMEVNLLISQLVCEISRLYEKQIVIEKQKNSQDFKKYSEKYEKQKSDIKQMQQYHVNKMNDHALEKQNLQSALEQQIKKLDELQSQQLPSNEMEKLQSDLRKHQSYLSEAEALLNEVNGQNQSLKKEIFELEQNLSRYESEILDLNKNLKTQKKMVNDQKQLYEVRVQSQEQEIEQHQLRYKELEHKMHSEITSQEKKLIQVQRQFEVINHNQKLREQDREKTLDQMQEMQMQVELVQRNDQEQRETIQKLNLKVQKREMELAEAVNTLRQFSESNRSLQLENENLKLEIEQMAGHRNPNQKIQLHLKIKEENNKLREDNFKLQEDLQKKIDLLNKKQIIDNQNALSPVNSKKPKELETLLNHILSCQQFQRLASTQGLQLDGTHSLQKIMEIITIADETLEEKKILPPRVPQGVHKQTYRSPAAPVEGSGGQRGSNQPKMISSSASAQQIISSTHTFRDSNTQLTQMQQFTRTGSQIRGTSGTSNSSRNLMQQHIDNLATEKNSLANAGNQTNSQVNLSIGSPVMLNSYSSLYKNMVQQRSNNNSALEAKDALQMRPEKENSLHMTQAIPGYAKKYRTRLDSQTHVPDNQKARSEQKNYK